MIQRESAHGLRNGKAHYSRSVFHHWPYNATCDWEIFSPSWSRFASLGMTSLLGRLDYFGASESTIFSKRGSPRSGSQNGDNLSSP